MAEHIDISERDFLELTPGAIADVAILNIEGRYHLIPPNSPFISLHASPSGVTQGPHQVFKIGVPAHAPQGVSTSFRLEGGGPARVIALRVI
mmetsp:Transcript_11198/g.22037  ORF Transcript_11198/g.22037 Transcript_11198/m.22037 type:complete len:92 (+) Transcript_11198:2231-2506(+)